MATFRDAFELARNFLGDHSGTKIKEGTIFAELTEAHRMVQRTLAEHGIGTMFADVTISVPLGALFLSYTSVPPLPTDLVVPHTLKEKSGGISGLYLPMERKVELPSVVQVAQLRVWRWITNQIQFVGSTRAVDILVNYEKELPAVTVLTDPILVRTGVGAVAHATAFLVNGTHFQEYMESCFQIVNSETRASQHQAVRRIPYGRLIR